MLTTDTIPDFLALESTPAGVWSYGRTVYQVYRLIAPLPWASFANVRLVLVGPRNAVYAVRFHGPRACVTFWNFSVATARRHRMSVSTPLDRLRIGEETFAAFLPAEG